MTVQRKVFWIGLLIYAAAFFLTAVGPSALPIRGYSCAGFALFEPLQSTPLGHGGVYEGRVFEYFSVLVSGWINPLFLVTAFLVFRGRHRLAVEILTILLLLMVPLCWVVFRYEYFYPREGHFMWILGMLLVLFSNELARGHHVDRIPIGIAKPL